MDSMIRVLCCFYFLFLTYFMKNGVLQIIIKCINDLFLINRIFQAAKLFCLPCLMMWIFFDIILA